VQEATESRAYANFIDSLRSESTKASYLSGLDSFKVFVGVESYDDLLSFNDQKVLQERIIDYVKSLRKRSLAYQSIRVLLSAVRHFYVMNDVSVNWPKIYKFVGERRKTVKDRIYTKDEIRRILEKCDERKKVMFLLLLTGMRIGALPDLKIRNLKRWPAYGIYQIAVYENTTSEYIAFTTLEAAQAIDSYLEFRKRAGEVMRPQNPLLREQFDAKDARNPRLVTLRGLYTVMQKPMIEAGIRKRSDNMHKRQDVMLFHGFRKYVNTMMNQAGVRPVIKEMLLGHKVGLENSYYRPADEEMLKEFLKASDLLTMSEEKQLREEVEKLTVENQEIGVVKKAYLDMRIEMEKKNNEVTMMREQMNVILSSLPKLKETDRSVLAKVLIERGIYEPTKVNS
jgi:integrase